MRKSILLTKAKIPFLIAILRISSKVFTASFKLKILFYS